MGGHGVHGGPAAGREEAPHGARPPAAGGAGRPAGHPALAGAFDPGRPGLKALALVAVAVAIVAAAIVWFTRPAADLVTPAPVVTANPAPETTGGVIVVAVSGRVRFPGLVRLQPGTRVADAITAAGGALPGTDLTGINLARKLVDGELIVVGVPGLAQGADGAGPGGKVNLNTATLAQLDGLPGVGPVLAQRILSYRDRHGPFRSVGELRQVEGIGDAKFEQLKDLVSC
jgi:competence protein ComEA